MICVEVVSTVTGDPEGGGICNKFRARNILECIEFVY